MTFYEQELRKLFADGSIIDKPTFVGRACLGGLGWDVRVRAEFVIGMIANQYTAIRLTVINRTDGPIDKIAFRFEDLLGTKQSGNPNFRNGVSPHIWEDGRNVDWYVYHPTKADYDAVRDTCRGYLEVFRDPQTRTKTKTAEKSKQRPCR